MNYLRLTIIAILFAVTAQFSHADSIPTFQVTQVTMIMGPNDGSGDNVGFSFTGPGVTITGTGGMGCFSWCSGAPIPSTSVAGPSEIFISSFNTVILGGQAYDPTLLGIDPFDAFGGVNAVSSGFVGSGDTFLQFNMTAPNGGWSFQFVPTTDQDGNPAFSFVSGSFSASAPFVTPEPGTISLVFSGLMGIGWITHKKGRFRR
jgi:hypothetical protein